MTENDVDNELLDYEDDEVENQAAGEGVDVPSKKDVKGSYVSIHSSGFRDFLLKPELLRAIVDCGFEHPSEDMRRDVQEIFRMTLHEKQVMMFSATLGKEIRPVCRKFMQDILLPPLGQAGFENGSELKSQVGLTLGLTGPGFASQPMEIFVDDETKLTLHGLQQYYVKLKDNEKNRKLFDLLDVLEFNQVVIFVKSVQRCIALAQLLVEQNFPAIAIHRGMPQEERLSRYQQFKDFQRRILVATNLFGRGMDIERVNIAFNYDMPEDSDTYLHRVARAGRFGTKGLAITFVSDENDAKILNEVQDRFEVNISELPDEIDISSYIEQTR
ncbi:hypothetical protein Chor_011577 [Crotalus horridus]